MGYQPRKYEDVSRFVSLFLATMYEGRYSRLYLQMPHLQAGEGRTLETQWSSAVSTHPRVEMGACDYRLCHQITKE